MNTRLHVSPEMLLCAITCQAPGSVRARRKPKLLSKWQVAGTSYAGGACLTVVILFGMFAPVISVWPEGAEWASALKLGVGFALSAGFVLGGPIGFFLGVGAYYGIFERKVSAATVGWIATSTLLSCAITAILPALVFFPYGGLLSIPLTMVAFFIICGRRSRLERKAGMS
jgi:hypothetical protein